MFLRTLPTRRAGHQVWAHPYTQLLTFAAAVDDDRDHGDHCDDDHHLDDDDYHHDAHQVWAIHTHNLTFAGDDNNKDANDDR